MVMRAATAHWEGDLFTGEGSVSLDSSSAAGPLEVNWPARAENPNGVTSPEELIAAAHATCYAMSLSNGLAKNGTPAETLDVTAQCHIEKGDAGFGITRVELSVRASVPDLGEDDFVNLANAAKDGCPVSKALKGNVEITLETKLG